MQVKIKAGVELEELRKYGFKTGKEWADAGERCLAGGGYDYQHGWYHKFSMDPDNPDKILYADEEYDQPMVQITMRENGGFSVDCTPSCTYHIGGSELDLVVATVHDLTLAGLLEVQDEE